MKMRSGLNSFTGPADVPSETRLNRGFLRQQADSFDIVSLEQHLAAIFSIIINTELK